MAAIAAGAEHTCALLADGTVRCWGSNEAGQLGDGAGTDPSGRTAVGVHSGIAIAAGGSHTCALLADGTVRCWGANLSGQLGDGTTRNCSTPVPVVGNAGATAIAAGGSHTCALLAGGAVECWGANHSGQSGHGNMVATPTPLPVTEVSRATALVAGGLHSCALLTGGDAKCWGASDYGQLANGVNILGSSVPVAVRGIAPALALAAGGSHTCGLVNDGTAHCAGANGSGQLGEGTDLEESPTPVAVAGLEGATALAAGGSHTCALLADGTVRCWGANDYGQLGDGTRTAFSMPRKVTVLR